MKRREPIEEMIEDFYEMTFDMDWDRHTSPEDVRNFAAYLSQVDEEMYPIGPREGT
jgi:hypothetical protein